MQSLNAQTIAIRNADGPSHGFLVLRDLDGKVLASGELRQVMHAHVLTSRTTFHFLDSSVDEEITQFTQDSHFHLLSDHRIQRGPSFPQPMDLMIDMRAGTVTRKSTKDGVSKEDIEHLPLPVDLANGLVLDSIKQLPKDAAEISLPMLTGESKSRIIRLIVTPEAHETYFIAGFPYKATRYLVKIDVGGAAGLLAPLIGRAPKDGHLWMANGEPPTMVRAESQFYLNGPIWRVELAGPTWAGK